MSGVTAELARAVILNSFASVARTEAYDVYASQQRYAYLGITHNPVTRERVAEELGDEAAAAWQTMKDAAMAYDVAVAKAIGDV